MRGIRKGYNLRMLLVFLAMVLSLTDFSYPIPTLRVPIDASKTKERISRYINPSSLSVGLSHKPNIIDNDGKNITLREGGIVAAYKSYSVTSEEDPITTCSLCIIRNTETGHYVAAHIIGEVFTYEKLDSEYIFANKAVPKMLSFLKVLDPNMNKKNLIAIVIGGGDQIETMQELALDNFNDLKQALEKEGISIVGEEAVSKYKKTFRFSGTGKVYITHSGEFRFSIQDSIGDIASDFRKEKNIKSFKTDIDTRKELYTLLITKETSLSFPKLVPGKRRESSKENRQVEPLTFKEISIITDMKTKRDDGVSNNFAFGARELTGIFLTQYEPPVEIKGAVLILPSSGNLPFRLMQHSPGPRSIVVVDKDEVTNAWLKAQILYGGMESLRSLLTRINYDNETITRIKEIIQDYVRQNKNPRLYSDNISIETADLLAGLPFGDDSFDTIIVSWLFGMSGGIKGKDNVRKSFKELLRIGRTGAQILISPVGIDEYSAFVGHDFDREETLTSEEYTAVKFGNKHAELIEGKQCFIIDRAFGIAEVFNVLERIPATSL